mgnify:CR=1 FL=1
MSQEDNAVEFFEDVKSHIEQRGYQSFILYGNQLRKSFSFEGNETNGYCHVCVAEIYRFPRGTTAEIIANTLIREHKTKIITQRHTFSVIGLSCTGRFNHDGTVSISTGINKK